MFSQILKGGVRPRTWNPKPRHFLNGHWEIIRYLLSGLRCLSAHLMDFSCHGQWAGHHECFAGSGIQACSLRWDSDCWNTNSSSCPEKSRAEKQEHYVDLTPRMCHDYLVSKQMSYLIIGGC